MFALPLVIATMCEQSLTPHAASMQSMVSAKTFVPAGKAGTCFGLAPLEFNVSLSTLKGIRANWVWDEMVESNRFRFPLCLTSVAPGSEADSKGLQVGDTIVSVSQRDERGTLEEKHVIGVDWFKRDPRFQVPHRAEGWLVDREVNGMLLRDVPCGLRVRRAQLQVCSSCNRPTLEERLDSWDHCLVCSSCGVVVWESLASNEAEWRSFADDDSSAQKQRVGAVAAAEEPVSSTFVSGGHGSGLARAHMAASKEQRARSKRERELLDPIEEVCTRMDLTGRIPAAAADIGRRFVAAREGSSKQCRAAKGVLAVACVYRACEAEGFHRTNKEMLAHAPAGCTHKSLNRTVKLLDAAVPRQLASASSSARACELLARFCSNLQLPAREALRVQAAAAAALTQHAPPTFADRHPTTLAAVAIARVSALSPARVSQASGAALTTILAALRAWPLPDPDPTLPPRPAANRTLAAGSGQLRGPCAETEGEQVIGSEAADRKSVV